MDGWGHGRKDDSNAIYKAQTPFVDGLYDHYPNSELRTHGEVVGLPAGQMGNSEVGHMNIGAGRIVYQELERINKAFAENSILHQTNMQKLIEKVRAGNGKVHLFGLVSDGGVHSHIDHFKGMIRLLHESHISNIIVHAFTDGRDCDPKSGAGFLKELIEYSAKKSAVVATVIGRYFGMDRDKRWERTKKAYDLLVNGVGTDVADIVEGIRKQYAEGTTDEFLEPMKLEGIDGQIEDCDIVIGVNFRTDRPRQIVEVLWLDDMKEYGMKRLNIDLFTMTAYDKRFKDAKVIFEKEDIHNTLGEVLSKLGKTQLRIAETEKYPHVTYFFNGGREVEFPGEMRIMIPSPKVATYDLQPEMSAPEVKDAVCKVMLNDEPDFICLNFANTDMVGHTGVFEAGMKAAETVDGCVQQIVELGLELGYTFLITADHGNSDCMVNEDGSPNTAHTTNLVPLFLVDKETDRNSNYKLKKGKLGDLAPTILKLMEIEIPEVMTGDCLIN